MLQKFEVDFNTACPAEHLDLWADTVRPLVLTAETGEEAAEWARRLRGLSAIENP